MNRRDFFRKAVDYGVILPLGTVGMITSGALIGYLTGIFTKKATEKLGIIEPTNDDNSNPTIKNMTLAGAGLGAFGVVMEQYRIYRWRKYFRRAMKDLRNYTQTESQEPPSPDEPHEP